MKKKKNTLPSGSYRLRLYVGKDEQGRQIYKSFTAPTKAEAEELARRYKRSQSDDTIAGAVRRYIELRSVTLSPTTINGYKSALKLLVDKYPGIMQKPALGANSDDIQALINGELLDGMSAKTATNRVLLVLSALDRINIHIDGYQLPTKHRIEIYVPTDAQVRLLATMADHRIKGAIYLAAFGPLRAGEVLGLAPEDISGNVIHVHRTMYYTGSGYAIKPTPKTYGSDRYIEMPAFVVEYLQKHGLPALNLKLLDYYFQRCRDACRLPRFRFHDLRHWCISTLHAQGMPDQYIMQRSGHNSTHTLQAVYRHTLADQSALLTAKAMHHFDSFL